MSEVDDMFINYHDSKKVKRVLTPDGYTIDKDGYEIFGVTLAEAEQGAEKVGAFTKDVAKGAARGGAKLTEGILTLLAAGTEKFIIGPDLMKQLYPEGDSIVKDIGEFYKNNIYNNIGEVETLAGGLTEGLSQFIVPGVGYYKLFNGLIKAKGVLPFITRALAAEGATVGTAQVAGDPNFAGFLVDIFNISTEDANSMTERYLEYLRTPENVQDGVDADEVFKEKWKAIQGDIVMGPVGEAFGPLLTKFFSGMKKIMKNEKVAEEITSFNLSDNTLTPKANKLEVESLLSFVKGNPDGFTISIDGKATPTSGFVLAPIKQTELIFDAKTIDYEDIVKLKDNVKFLFKTYQDMGMDNVRVYAGGWLNKDTNKYVLDASVIIDNKADALYIANAGKQDAIFDLGEFNEIKTTEGIEELKQSGSYDIDKFNVRQSDNVKLVEGFEGARLASEGGTN